MIALSKRLVFGCLCALYLPGVAMADSSDSSDSLWVRWFQNQVHQHPKVVAAKEKMNAAFSIADSLEQPLYNPELETEFEREGDANNYQVGINQTVDWGDKRGIGKQMANANRSAAEYDFTLTVQQQSAQSLQALIKWHAANHQARLALKQENQLGTLLDLVKERQRAGDLGQVDAELTVLGLSQTFNTTAQALAQLKQERAHLRELLPDWSPESAQIPERIWLIDRGLPQNSIKIPKWEDEHPAVMAARAEWDGLQKMAELASKKAKADPTFGIAGGKTDDENVLALTFSIPLNVRNNFNAEEKAAHQEALAAEAQYQAIRRKKHYAIRAAYDVLQEYQQRAKRWQDLMAGRSERSQNLLEKQWRSGDMSTTEYLLALQQLTEGSASGIELREQFQLAQIEWLFQTGKINAALQPM